LRARRLPGKYLLENFGDFVVVRNTSKLDEVFLGFRMNEVQNSIVTLSIDADDIQFIINRLNRLLYSSAFESFVCIGVPVRLALRSLTILWLSRGQDG
jgi:hypothetical protein